MSNEKCLELISKINDENVNEEIMRQSLSSITKELQRFHFYCGANAENNLFKIVNNYKSNEKFKKNKLKILNDKLKTACMVAKTVTSAKERESHRIQSRLAEIENNSTKVIEENIKFQQIIHELTRENQKLCNKMNILHNCIDLGYEQLQNIRNEPVDKINLFNKFKMILLYCGQYYSDFHNANLCRKQLEQKIRLYNLKLKILENNIVCLSEELIKLRRQNKNVYRRNDYEKRIVSNIPIYLHGPGERKRDASIQSDTLILNTPEETTTHFDLTLHLSLVKKLLADQDNMIQCLNKFCNEFSGYIRDCTKQTN